MTEPQFDRISPFNSAVELGLRALVLLNEAYPNEYSLRRLVILDYIVVHSDDIPDGPEGLHPKTPYRSGEILVRRAPLQSGLMLFRSRGLIDERYRENGVFYAAGDQSESFLDAMSNEYLALLRQRAVWTIERFGVVPLEEMESLIRENIGQWGAEFEFNSVLWSRDEQ